MRFHTMTVPLLISAAFLLAAAPRAAVANPYTDCLKSCTSERDQCIADAHSIAQKSQCVATLNGCTSTCRKSFPQGPAPTRIGSIDPLWGWSGDKVRITGNSLFDQLSITVGGQPAAIISTNSAIASRSFDIVDFRIPTVNSTVLGPVSFPMVIKAGGREFSFVFDYSPVIQAAAHREIAPGGGFIGLGYVWTHLSLNRETGQITAIATANNYGGPFDALPFSIGAAFFDGDGKPLGSMLTKGFSAPGVQVLTSGPRQTDYTWVDNLRPATSVSGLNVNRVRFAVLRVSLLPQQEMDARILNWINFGMTMESFVAMAF